MNPLEYVARGWSIFPCHGVEGKRCSCSAGTDCKSPGKHPRTVHGVKDATTDPLIVQRWVETWGDKTNWALATGVGSDVVVVDVDPRSNGDVSWERWLLENDVKPVTLTALTGGGGFHLFFRYPHDGNEYGNRASFLPGVDFKTDGGYVILPPGRHVSGRQYAWSDFLTEIASMPQTLASQVRSSPADTKKIDFSNLERIGSGQRNDVLFRLACRTRRQHSDDKLIVEAVVRAYNMFRCDPPLDDAEITKIIGSAFAQNHNDGSDVDVSNFLNLVTVDGDPVHHTTDDGNAMRFVEYHGAHVRYVDTWGWMTWNGHKWAHDSEGLTAQDRARRLHEDVRRESAQLEDPDAQERLLKWAFMTESAARVAAALSMAKSDSRIHRSYKAFDVDPKIISCRNGVLNLDTGEMRPHLPDDCLTRCTNVDYDPTAKLDEWESFIWHACDNDATLVEYLQRAAGYTLTGMTVEECFFILVGPAASGKSTFVGGMQAALGDYAGSFASDTILMRGQQPRRENDLAGAVGKRFMSVVEIPEGERLDEAAVKQLTGGDDVQARFLYKNPFTYRPKFKLWIATNHPPRISDDAIWRRIKKIPFPQGLPSSKRDPRIKAAIQNPELGGKAVLAWAVEGYRMYQQTRLDEPQRVKLETQAYYMQQDRVGQFLDEAVELGADDRADVGVLYMRYTAWCVFTNERPFTLNNFAIRLSGRPGLTLVTLDGRQWIRGLRLKQQGPNGHGLTGQSEGGSQWGI